MANTRKVPQIRFKGFEGEWEERALKKVMNDFIVPMRDKPTEFGGNIPWTRIEDIEDRFINGTLSNQYVSETTIQKMNLKIIPKDSLIVSASASFGIVAIVSRDLITNQTFIGLVPNESNDLNFLYTFFQSSSVQDTMRKKSAGSTIFYISQAEFKEMTGVFPQLKEQSQIGTFFQNIDSLITLHQRKHDKLITVKKAMLEKMFPKDGADVPEIRFMGFSGKWDRYTFGEIITETKRPIEMLDGKVYELVTVKRRNEGVVSRGLLKGKDILVKNYFQLRTGDFIISKRQVVHGATGLVPPSLDKAIASNEYLVAIGNEKISTDFLALLSKLPIMYKLFFISSFGVDIEKLVFDVEDWKKRMIAIPKPNEQQKITAYFTHLDSLITLQQRELDKLKSLKNACLEKMFV